MTDGGSDIEDPKLGGLFETNRWIAEVIAEHVPELIRVQDGLVDGLRPLAFVVHESMEFSDPVQRARSRIVNQAMNDFLDVFGEAISGRGRPAIRSARTLYEHLVNHRWTTADPAEAQRYVDQAAIGALLDLELDTPTEDAFKGKRRLAFRHWHKGLAKRVVPAADEVLKKYGSSFKSRWSATNLYDRAKANGLDGEYESYRLMSAVIHGSAGGDLGHRIERDGVPVVRAGPALAVCPLALRVGTRYFGLLLADLETAVGPEATTRLQAVIAVIERNLEKHRDTCFGLDQTIWPEHVPQTILYLKVTADGQWIWMLRDPERDLTIRADPTLTPARMAKVRADVEQAEAANPGRTKPMFIAMKGTATPRPGAPWLPVSETLRPQELRFGPKPNYQWLDVKDPLRDPSLFD